MNVVNRITNRIVNKGFRLAAERVNLADFVSTMNTKLTERRFVYGGREYPYLFHSYNNFGLTERSVEMPIVKHYLTSRPWRSVLEIGNVTGYYADYFVGAFPNKTVVDKLETDCSVVTKDVAEYDPGTTFDFVFSVSTFEHMDSDLGRNKDYRPGTTRHGTVAADNIVHCYEKLLAPGGLMMITAPLGYTPEWDATWWSETLTRYPFTSLKKRLVSRISEQEWAEVTGFAADREYAYGRPYPYANHVSIFEITK